MRNRTQTIQDKGYLNAITCLQVKTLANKVADVQNPEIQEAYGSKDRTGSAVQTNDHHNLKCAKPWRPQQTIRPKWERQLLAREEEKNCNVGQLLQLFVVLEALPRDCLCEEIYQHLRENRETKGPLKTEELQAAEKFWVAQAQAVGAPNNKCKLWEGR